MSNPTAYDAALSGDLRGLSDLRDQGPLWQGCASLLQNLAGGSPVGVPNPEDLASIDGLGGPGTEALLDLCGLRCLLHLDHSGLDRVISCLEGFGDQYPFSKHRFSSWRLLLAGDGASADSIGERLQTDSSSAGDAVGVVEAQVLRAAAAMILGDMKGALALSRRAARMAQSEHLWLSHYLASIVLCRVRRLSGQAHLAARIAEACLAATGPEWHLWLQWERLFAGVSAGVPPAASLAAIEQWFTIGSAQPELEERFARSAPHARDFHAAKRALSIDEEPGEDEVGEWIRGEVDGVPSRLCGLTALRRASDPGLPAVVARRGHASRRSLLVPAYIHRLGPSGSQPTRVDTIVAVAALASAVVDRAELFSSVYGFGYRPAIHEATFKVLRSSAKAHVSEVADLHSSDGYRLEVHKDFAFADPRCQQSLSEIMLRFLGHTGRAGAKEVAQELAVPLRTVQNALRGLVDEGACIISKEGRRVLYVVEDTTFCEITVA